MKLISAPILLCFITCFWVTMVSGYYGDWTTWTWNPNYERGEIIKKRWAAVKAIPPTERSISKLTEICGPMPEKEEFIKKQFFDVSTMCGKIVGRPDDEGQIKCDRMCAFGGYATGSCGTKVGMTINLQVVGSIVAHNYVQAVLSAVNIANACRCSDDIRDASCGPDGSFLGIRCPFDWSACRRKCCRNGFRNGSCGGFLNTKCKCSN